MGGTMNLQVYAAAHRIDVIAEVLSLDPAKANDVLGARWDDNGSENSHFTLCDGNSLRGAIRESLGMESPVDRTKYPKFYGCCKAWCESDLSLLGIAGDLRRRYKARKEQLRVIAFLVEECGANVNYSNDEGITPLAAAAARGYRDIVKYLLAKGADPNLNPPTGRTIEPC